MVSLKVMVGDLVKVEDQQQIPADLLLFSSSLRWHSSFNCHPMTIRQHHRNHHRNLHQRSGGCFVMTANLDGETNLKPLTAPKWEKFRQFGILKELLIFHLDFAFLGNFVFEFFLSTGKLGSSSRPRASDSWKPRLQFSNKVFNDYTQYNHFEHSNYLAIWI